MAKYISKPFRYLDNTIGVEINFNKVFYKPQQLEPLENILSDLGKINAELQNLETSLNI